MKAGVCVTGFSHVEKSKVVVSDRCKSHARTHR